MACQPSTEESSSKTGQRTSQSIFCPWWFCRAASFLARRQWTGQRDKRGINVPWGRTASWQASIETAQMVFLVFGSAFRGSLQSICSRQTSQRGGAAPAEGQRYIRGRGATGASAEQETWPFDDLVVVDGRKGRKYEKEKKGIKSKSCRGKTSACHATHSIINMVPASHAGWSRYFRPAAYKVVGRRRALEAR